MAITRLLVNRTNIAECRLAERPLPALADGEILVATRDFALTANNISYALSGDQLGYWRFFPEDADWGIVPVFGFAEIVDSRCADVPKGTGIWGYLPMASHFVMQPGHISARGFVDAAAHRQCLPLVYNQYALTAADSPAMQAAADARSLLFPLFTTAYLIADYFADNALFGARQFIIGSASSKTGFGTAHYLAALPERPEAIVGLTSPRNIDFTRRLGMFDTVLDYGDIAALDPAIPSVYIDMSGDGAVLEAVHRHFGDRLVASMGVGATHWDAPRHRTQLPGATPAFFFAPAQIAKRDGEWGAGEVMRRANEANLAFAATLGDLLTITRSHGADAIAARYRDMAANRTSPTEGQILSFGDPA